MSSDPLQAQQTTGLREWEADLTQLPQRIVQLRVALNDCTRRANPERWCGLQRELGHALYRLGERHGDRRLLKSAILAYRKAQLVRQKGRKLANWASTSINLATAISSLGDLEASPATLESAIGAFQDLIASDALAPKSPDWALAYNNLGNAFFHLSDRSDERHNLQAAVSAYRSALKGRPRSRLPLEWAMSKNNLATALQRLGVASGNNQLLRQSVTTYRSALRVYSRRQAPRGWGMVQGNLGAVLQELGEREQDPTLLLAAAAAYRAALRERTKEAAPMDWAATNHNLATLYTTLADRDEAPTFLTKAVEAYEQALSIWTPKRSPLDWVLATAGLGRAYLLIGSMTANRASLERAIDLFRAAGSLRSDALSDRRRSQIFDRLGAAFLAIGRHSGDASRFLEAAGAFRQALALLSLEDDPVLWASRKAAVGDALLAQAQWTRDRNAALAAIEHYREALAAAEPVAGPGAPVAIRHSLASALFCLGEIDASWEPLDAAEVEFRGILASLPPRGAGLVQADITTEFGELLYSFGRYSEAIDQFGHALHCRAQLTSEVADAVDIHAAVRRTGDLGSALAYCYAKLGRFDDGLAAFETAQAVDLARNVQGSIAPDLKPVLSNPVHAISSAVPPGCVGWLPVVSRAGTFVYVIRSSATGLSAENLVEIPDLNLTVLDEWRRSWLEGCNGVVHGDAASDPVALASHKETLVEMLGALWTSLVGPILAHTPICDDDELIVVTAGELSGIPVHAAQDAMSGRHLLDHCTVRYAPSFLALDVAERRAVDSARRGHRLVGLFDPQDDRATTALPLSQSVERPRMLELFKDQVTFVGRKASVRRLMSEAQWCNYLHFSCHGHFDAIEPTRSGLALARGEVLTVARIGSSLSLPRCRLVATAACETGLAAIGVLSGEQIGLPAAFLAAGAPAIFATLWPVIDRSTTLLAARFYELHVVERAPPAHALRQAILDLRDGRLAYSEKEGANQFAPALLRAEGSSEPGAEGSQAEPLDYTSPFFWAGFVLIGA